MTVLEALAILEAAVLECKKREVDTPELRAALDLLEPHIQPAWLILQFRNQLSKNAPTTMSSVRVCSRCFALLSPHPLSEPLGPLNNTEPC
jgi:hypothetical protein